MKQFYFITAKNKISKFDWSVIEQYLIDLPYSDKEFVVLGSLVEDDSYIQTRINTDSYQTKGLYELEVRIPLDVGFKHYQIATNDAVKVIGSFSEFYNKQPIDVGQFKDITGEFDKPTIVTDSQL